MNQIQCTSTQRQKNGSTARIELLVDLPAERAVTGILIAEPVISLKANPADFYSPALAQLVSYVPLLPTNVVVAGPVRSLDSFLAHYASLAPAQQKVVLGYKTLTERRCEKAAEGSTFLTLSDIARLVDNRPSVSTGRRLLERLEELAAKRRRLIELEAEKAALLGAAA